MRRIEVLELGPFLSTDCLVIVNRGDDGDSGHGRLYWLPISVTETLSPQEVGEHGPEAALPLDVTA